VNLLTIKLYYKGFNGSSIYFITYYYYNTLAMMIYRLLTDM